MILHIFDLGEDGRDVALITAEVRRRNATDAACVALARRHGRLALDGSLARNARSRGLPVRELT